MALQGLYRISLDTFAEIFTPTAKRKPKTIAWVQSLLEGLKGFQETVFDVFIADTKFFYRPNSQKLIFENHMNEVFGLTAGNKIYIENQPVTGEPDFLWNESEFLGAKYYYNQSEMSPRFLFNESEIQRSVGFIVYYPSSLDVGDQLAQLDYIVNSYRCAGTTYLLKPY